MKIKRIFTCALIVTMLAACSNTAVQPVESETTTQQTTLPQTQQTTLDTQNTIVETETTANTQIVNVPVAFDVETLADTYAQVVIDRIKADQETKEENNRFRPMYADDFMKINSLMYLLDVNFDGVPELFIGTAGTTGGGSYDIIKSDGTLLGKDVHCCSWLDSACVIDGVMYMFNGLGSNPGWVKFVEETPSVTLHSWLNTEEAVNTVDVTKADGTVETFENQSLDDIKTLYKQYLDVDYDLLQSNTDATATLISGVLTVPDPEQYTVIDISDCVKALLEEYVVVKNPKVSEKPITKSTIDVTDYPVQTSTVTAYTTYTDFFANYTDNVWDLIPYDFNNDAVDELLVVHNTSYRATLLYKTDGKVTVLPFDGHNGRVYVDDNSNILSIDDRGDTYGTYGYMLATVYAWNGEQYSITQTASRDAGYVEYDDDGNVIEDSSYYGQAYIDGVAVSTKDFDTFMAQYAEDVTAKMTHIDTRISTDELATVITAVD